MSCLTVLNLPYRERTPVKFVFQKDHASSDIKVKLERATHNGKGQDLNSLGENCRRPELRVETRPTVSIEV